ncbi:MAG TPA: hypothetical protein PL033_19640 [Candidatus Brocadiia bacterium]|nr:hypothetical protein [Candidatus Brocadiia bacterium]
MTLSRRIAAVILLAEVPFARALPAQKKGIAGEVSLDQIQQEKPRRWAVLIGVNEYDGAGVFNDPTVKRNRLCN